VAAGKQDGTRALSCAQRWCLLVQLLHYYLELLLVLLPTAHSACCCHLKVDRLPLLTAVALPTLRQVAPSLSPTAAAVRLTGCCCCY
jgi:hypothetical protein